MSVICGNGDNIYRYSAELDGVRGQEILMHA